MVEGGKGTWECRTLFLGRMVVDLEILAGKQCKNILSPDTALGSDGRSWQAHPTCKDHLGQAAGSNTFESRKLF